MKAIVLLIVVSFSSVSSFADAFDEVNASRRAWGRRALVRDQACMEAAQRIAEWQAFYQISLANGYNGHEHPRWQPEWATVGTGVSSSFGWNTCLMEATGSWRAGAGVAIGSDGKRYMALVIQDRSGGHRGLTNYLWMQRTRHLTPNPPVMATPPMRVPAYPVGRSYSPTHDWLQYPSPRYASSPIPRPKPNHSPFDI